MSFKYYQPVLSINGLVPNKPTRALLGSMPVVLIKQETKVFAYEDFCPHRGAPLSEGSIVNGQLQCPYHGWQFSVEDGHNTFVPVKNEPINCRLQSIYVQLAYDIIWLSYEQDAILPTLMPNAADILLSGKIEATMLNTLENFLEGSHTHFVHNGLVRTQNKKRNAIQASLEQNENGFSVFYDLEPAKGLLTKLLPKKYQRLQPTSTYIHPYIAILEYKNEVKESIARFEAILTQGQEEVYYIARVFLNIGWIANVIKPLICIMFQKVIHQDKYILELQQGNLNRFKNQRFVSDETDTVGKYLFAWQNGRVQEMPHQIKFEVYW